MNQDAKRLLFALLRSAIRGDLLNKQELGMFKTVNLQLLIDISKEHDLTHMLALGLNQNSLLDAQNSSNAEKEILKAVYRYEQLNYELNRICGALEAAGIDFMPLKGSVIRQYYSEPWLRTSCDIDILVREEDLDTACECLIKNFGYVFNVKGSHDISLIMGNRVHLELHYTLIGEDVAKSSGTVLSDVWKSAFVQKGKQHWYKMPDEMFYFYHIAHMAKHFENGGCGIRSFIDLWILNNIENADKKKRDMLLKQGDLLRFAEVASALSEIWMNDSPYTDITRQMESYILVGGVYGTNENRIAVQQQKKGGRLRYALSKIFIPYDIIKFHYPILHKHRWLTPVMEVRRWFKLVFCGHAKRTIRELRYNKNISELEAENTQVFLNNIGL